MSLKGKIIVADQSTASKILNKLPIRQILLAIDNQPANLLKICEITGCAFSCSEEKIDISNKRERVSFLTLNMDDSLLKARIHAGELEEWRN